MRITPVQAGPCARAPSSYVWLAAGALALTGVSCAPMAGKAAMAPMAEPMAQDVDMAGAADGGDGDGDAGNGQRAQPAQQRVAMVARAARGQNMAVARRDGENGEWAAVREFPVPDYSGGPEVGPRRDFRETIYWAPSIKTDASGQAKVAFYLSDAVTSFRATAEGLAGQGAPARGEALLASKLPVALAAKLPLEVSYGDTVSIPVTVENTTRRWRKARVTGQFGPAFKLVGKGARATRTVTVGPGRASTVYYDLRVIGRGRLARDGQISLTAQSGQLSDSLQRVVKVSPGGFPDGQALAGTLATSARHRLVLPATVPETVDATLRLYPSPVATMLEGTEALIREPSGCFEQTSSSNYPNVMVMRYLAANNALDSGLVARTQKTLDRGYKKLTGYESQERGFEWFGKNPGHEALTAYGLMQFVEMAEVYPGLDKAMVKRTQDWLKSRRDGNGGYQRNSRALDTFGRASQEVTDAYITYALAKTGDRDLGKELEKSRAAARSSNDPYVLALSAGALLHANSGDEDGVSALVRLASMQNDQGQFVGARESITRSGGISLAIETTALASLAMMSTQESKKTHGRAVQKAIDWMISQRSGGRFGATQSTILAMEAMTTHAREFGRAVPGATIEVAVNGTRLDPIALDGNGKEGIVVPGIERFLRTGENTIELSARLPEGQEISLPYELTARYRVAGALSSDKSPVTISTKLSARRTRMGRPVRLRAQIRNTRDTGQPMVIGRIGIPGGLTYQVWQLDELRDRGVVDFYETREREVIVYFRDMAPSEVKNVELQLLASVPGRYESPESATYLYYTDEYRQYARPTAIHIKPPWRARAKSTTKKRSAALTKAGK